MYEQRKALLELIVVRLLLAGFVVGLAWLVLQDAGLLSLLLPSFPVVAVLSGVFLLLWKYSPLDDALYYLQFYTDLGLVTALVLFSGGISSLFGPFYVLIIVYASLLKGRGGGILALTLSILSYVVVTQLAYLGFVPGSDTTLAYADMAYRFCVNILAFTAVAFLGIYLSERLSRVRKELGKTKAVHQNIIDSIRGGLLTTDHEGRITFVNRVGANILEWEQEAMLDAHLDVVLPEGIFERVTRHDYRTTSRALRLEQSLLSPAGSRLYLGMACSPLLSEEGETSGYVFSFQDLTEIKKREDEYQFREKMAAIGEMAAGLAHELRNPLGSLSGSIQILRSELQLAEDQARLLDIVLRESERLNRIVEDFLQYARTQPSNRETVDLAALVEETARLLQNSPEFDQKRHAVVLETPGKRRLCQGNPDQLRQVAWNILVNGIRAMPEGGRLTISVTGSGERLCFQVMDEGVGMDDSEKARMFQPFHSKFSKGAGLGMPLVYQIIQQHRGTITVDSEPGRGTTVSILLPSAGSENPG